jgi:DNA-binding MarR family transcriptional regulator
MALVEESTKHITDMLAVVSSLDRQDIGILEDLEHQGSASNVELVAHLVQLPSDVNKSLERLRTLGFVEAAPLLKSTIKASAHTVRLSVQGKKIVRLLPLIENMREQEA